MDERGIVDQSALRMRAGTVAAGVWLSYVVVAAAALYVSLTWDRPHRVALSVLYGVGLLGALVISRLPRERIVRSAFREQFFLTWSVLDLGLIVTSVALDGGTRSPLALVLFVPVVFAAMSYPLASVLLVGALSMFSYLGIAVLIGGAPWSYQALFTAMLFCTGAMSAWQARNHDRQHQALMDVSRADALTGCLNRRGFEERAIAEIASAARGTRQGAVLVLDLDRFKDVNDRLGHAAGDELLRWVVTTARGAAATARRDRAPRRRRVRRAPGRRGPGRGAGDRGPAGTAAAPPPGLLDRRREVPDGRCHARGADAGRRRAALRVARGQARAPRHGRRGAAELGRDARPDGGHAHGRRATSTRSRSPTGRSRSPRHSDGIRRCSARCESPRCCTTWARSRCPSGS